MKLTSSTPSVYGFASIVRGSEATLSASRGGLKPTAPAGGTPRPVWSHSAPKAGERKKDDASLSR